MSLKTQIGAGRLLLFTFMFCSQRERGGAVVGRERERERVAVATAERVAIIESERVAVGCRL